MSCFHQNSIFRGINNLLSDVVNSYSYFSGFSEKVNSSTLSMTRKMIPIFPFSRFSGNPQVCNDRRLPWTLERLVPKMNLYNRRKRMHATNSFIS